MLAAGHKKRGQTGIVRRCQPSIDANRKGRTAGANIGDQCRPQALQTVASRSDQRDDQEEWRNQPQGAGIAPCQLGIRGASG